MRNIFFRSLHTVVFFACWGSLVHAGDADTVKEGGEDTIVSGSTSVSEEHCPAGSNMVVILQGSRMKSSVKYVLDSVKSGMKSYYRKRQKEHTEYCGSMCLQVVIEPNGRVSAVTAVVPSGDEQLTREVEKRFRAIRFGYYSEGGVTEALYSLDFEAKSNSSSSSSGCGESEGMCLRFAVTIPLLILLFFIPRLFHP